jgi:hypothetical protein
VSPHQLKKAVETRLWMLIEHAGEGTEQQEQRLAATTEDVLRLCRENPGALGATKYAT